LSRLLASVRSFCLKNKLIFRSFLRKESPSTPPLGFRSPRCTLTAYGFSRPPSRTHVTGFTDNGARMRTLTTRGFVSLRPDEGKTAARQPAIFDKSARSWPFGRECGPSGPSKRVAASIASKELTCKPLALNNLR